MKELSFSEVSQYAKNRLPFLIRTSPRSTVLRGPCPVHGGVRPSFALDLHKGMAFCHSECNRGWNLFQLEQELTGASFDEARAEVLRAAGRLETPPREREIAATYPYYDERGQFLYEVVRFEPKGFAVRRPNGAGGVVWNLGDTRRVLYRLPKLAAAPPDQEVWVVEGEKDVESLERLGLLATCNPGGAGKWRDEYSEALRHRTVVIVPDHDPPGFAHAAQVGRSLRAAGARTRFARLQDAKDVSEWLSKGGSMEQLRESAGEDLREAEGDRLCEAAGDTLRPSTDPWPDPWPAPIEPAAFHGLAGRIVASLEPHTEADPVAILVQLLTVFGNLVGRTAHFQAEDDSHYGNLFSVLVGDSSKGRKGTSFGRVRRVAALADPVWAEKNIAGGLASGEGLLWHVRDAVTERSAVREKGRVVSHEDVVVDAGVSDKRLLVVEPEFARVLQVCEREANTLSAVLRQAWDTGRLHVLTKKMATTVTGAHLSIIGHITREELRRLLSSTAAANGFANRFLWVAVRRSKVLPEGSEWPVSEWTLWGEELRHALAQVRSALPVQGAAAPLRRDSEARELWHQVYPELSRGGKSLAAAVTSRAEAQTMRLAMLYALLDGKSEIGIAHLQAALALWRYCERSVAWLFADADPMEAGILDALGVAGELTRSELLRRYSNQPASQVVAALESLRAQGRIERGVRTTRGRAAEVWFLLDGLQEKENVPAEAA